MVGSTFKTMYLVSKSEVDNNTKKNFKLSLQNKDICNGGMSVSVKPIKTRKRHKPKVEKSMKPLKRSDDDDDDADDDDDDGENGDEGYGHNHSRQQNRYSKQKIQNFPSYGFRPQNYSDDENKNKRGDNNADLFQRQLANYEQPKQDFYKLDPIKRRWDETKQLKRQRLNNEENSENAAHDEQKNFVSDDQLKRDPPTYLDMEESSDDGGQTEKHDDKTYIAYDKDKNNNIDRNAKNFESEENLKDESMNKSNDVEQFKHGVNIRKGRKRNKIRKFEKRKRIAHTKRVSRDQEKREMSFDRLSPIALTDHDLGKEDVQSNENKKHKFDNDGNNQPILEEINLKRRKILDDINKLKDDQWLGRIKSRLNDKRVQFKRKRDTVGYRINPDDINDKRARIQQTVKNKDDMSKSLIKPSDFTYLNKTESADFLDKWRPLKELRSKPVKNKRFKPYH